MKKLDSSKKMSIRKNGSKRVVTINTEPSKTDQSFKSDCDIQEIIAKFRKTGQVTHLNKKQGIYADVSQIPDLLGATMIVQDASEKFSSLPSGVRDKFNNDPINMIQWLNNPDNQDEGIKLGLFKARQNDDLNDKQSVPQQTIKQNKTSSQNKTDKPESKNIPEPE